MVWRKVTAKLEGYVDRVDFQNPESGFSVLRVKSDSHKALVTLVGRLSPVDLGEFLIAHGCWELHPDFGLQFEATSISLGPPRCRISLEKFLSTGAIDGLTPHLSHKLLTYFDSNGFDGFTEITKSWEDYWRSKAIVEFFVQHGFSYTASQKIGKTYGPLAIEIIKQNPFQLIWDIEAIDFKCVDRMAQSLSMNSWDFRRREAALIYLLKQKMCQGHRAYPREDILLDGEILSGLDVKLLIEALSEMLKSGVIIQEEIGVFACLYFKAIWELEQKIANQLLALNSDVTPKNLFLDLEKYFSELGRKKINLDARQKLAIHTALTQRLSLIIGGVGSGKKMTLRNLAELLNKNYRKTVVISSTLGGRRTLSGIEGVKVISFEEISPSFDAEWILVYEAELLSYESAAILFQALGKTTSVVLFGDIDFASPKMGHGIILRELIQSKVIPFINFSHLQATLKNSPILTNAYRIREGLAPELIPHRQSNFFFLESDSDQNTSSLILNLVRSRLPSAYGYKSQMDIQILCSSDFGACGSKKLNREIQKMFALKNSVSLDRYGIHYREGDRVISKSNLYDFEIENGDIGWIKKINYELQTVAISFENRMIQIPFHFLNHFEIAYSVSIQSLNRNDFKVVIIPLSLEHRHHWQRFLFYSAITRGRELVIMVGEKKVLEFAIKKQPNKRLWSGLSKKISFKNSEYPVSGP